MDNEELRVKVKALQYEVDNLKSQRDFAQIQYEKDLRDANVRAEDGIRRTQVGFCREIATSPSLIDGPQTDENRRIVPVKKYEELNSKFKDAQDKILNLQAAQDKELRKIREDKRAAEAEAEEARSDLTTLDRESKQALKDAESKRVALDREVKDSQTTLSNANSTLDGFKERLAKKEAEASELESENIRLKARSGDAETIEIIKRDLAEQVAHIRKLESVNRDQNNQLKTFRQKQKAVEIVEEEKRTLEMRLRVMDDLEKELQEARLQRQNLEDEKKGWNSYLQNQTGEEETEFSSPEDMARALVKERVEKASTLERMGALQSEIVEKETSQQILTDERDHLQNQLDNLKAKSPATAPVPNSSVALDSRTKKALERQRAMAQKEAEFLREQLRTFDSEEQTYHSSETNQFDAVKTKRIEDLEAQIDEYRRELAALTNELSAFESQPKLETLSSPFKRSLPSDESAESERIGQLNRKNRTLVSELAAVQSAHAVLQNDHKALSSQLQSLQSRSRTRVLELRSNPTSEYERIKLTTLKTLKQENKDLLARLEENNNEDESSTVPKSVLQASKLETLEQKRLVSEKEKRISRLMQVYGEKSLEFREAVFHFVGWNIHLRPDKKWELSLNASRKGEGGEVAETLIFDTERGDMKVKQGMNTPFARGLRPLTEEWVGRKKYIPGLMAQVLLDKVEDGTVIL